jgi:hypothetical protein
MPPGYAYGDIGVDYSGLITSEHRDKPRFMATVEALTNPALDMQLACQDMISGFNLDVAVGKQLDIDGEWVGISRRIPIPLENVYFSWDATPLLGWDSGVWQGLFDPDSGLAELGDEDYRQLIRAKIAANAWDGTMEGAERIWGIVFAGAQTIIVQDNQDMTMTLGFVGNPLNAVQRALLEGGYFPLKPSGVRIRFYAIPIDTGPLFAWDADSPELQGWDTGRWAQEISP